ncbi:GNAT family N-acetyltransferase [Brachybacterium sp. AOP25-B2-12]|uniref:GNAT family N-acetyltransferase n=1 Tax=Brachybacterium sp. AOP25-B2-12 TaxID=3457710 RepID=UPI0040346BE7
MTDHPVPPRVVPFDRAHLDETAAVLARAFAPDPIGSALVPSDRPVERLTLLFRANLERVLLSPHAIDLAVDPATWQVLGATIWVGPDREGSGAGLLDGLIGTTRAAALAVRATGPLLGRLVRTEREGERARPTSPHWYLESIGADPRAGRRGVGKALLNHRLAILDRLHLPAYLESSKPANDPYYERFGFRGIGTLSDRDLPTMTRMWREPA